MFKQWYLFLLSYLFKKNELIFLFIGKCNILSNNRFNCTCQDGWYGTNCEIMVHYCDVHTCKNRGVCRPILNGFKCECLGDSYYGLRCEFTARRIILLKIFSKSCAYISIIAMVTVAMFVVIMDILKYCFGIDPVEVERKRMPRKKQAKKRKPPVIQRFTYVNAPHTSDVSDSTITETTV